VLGVDDQQAARPVAEKATEVVEVAAAFAVAKAGVATTRAGLPPVNAGAPSQKRLREVFNAGNALGAGRDIFSRSHGWLL
jgi:hypothetical protein